VQPIANLGGKASTMFSRISWLSASMLAGLVSPAVAQLPATVQLPSFSYFGVDTSVSVPDRGSMSLGGVGRSSTGSTAFGPVLGPRSRSFGRQMSASSTTVHATIHDFDAMDRQLLDQARKSYRISPRAATSTARGEASSAAAGPAGSVAEARRMYAAERSAQDRDALGYMDQAERAAARGKPQVARVLYQMAERRASGELKAEIRERLVALKPAAK
jgi:hypothetical protein